MRTMHVEAGATIFRAGDASCAVYVIEDGEVVITVGDAAGKIGNGTAGGVEVARLHAGELFGESGVLEARVRAATATASTATTLLVTDAEAFVHAFGMDNDRALSLVKLLCRRLRDTSRRAAQPGASAAGIGSTIACADSAAASEDIGDAVIRLMPDRGRLVSQYHMVPIEVRRLPFRVGNRYGGETRPMSSEQSFCLDAFDEPDLAAPHFEIVRCGGELGVRDMGSRVGTIVNGNVVDVNSSDRFVPLFAGANDVVAGRPNSPFRFRIQVREA